MRLLTTVCFSSLLLLSLADGSQSQENDSKQPFDLTPSLDEAMSSAHLHKDEPAVSDPTPEPEPEPEPEPTAIATPVSEPEPEPTPEPQPEPEPTVQDLKKATEPQGAPEPSPEPEPEPAIKFDNIDQSEDYGDVAEVKNTPDAVDDGIIEELVERFLNTGSVENQKNETKFTNPAAQALINSSPYWNTDDLKPPGAIKDAEETKKWLEGYQTEAAKVLHEVAASGWKYVANASPFAKTALNEAEQVLSRFVRSTAMQAKQFDFEQLSDSALQRQMNFVTFEGMSALSPKSYASFNQALHKINRDISDTAVCDQDMSPPCALKKIDLESIFHNEKDASRLSTLWVNYVTGIAKTKSSYQTIIDRSNEGAKLNGFADGGAMWRSAFDLSTKSSPPVYDMKKRLNELYQSIKPFYTQLHAYLRRQIAGMYENASDLSKDGPIPAHLFGSVKGGDWSSHYEQTKPYDDEESVAEDMLNAFRVQNYTSKQMFIKAYRYFKSVGFPVLPRSFWTKSLFSRVWSKDMICNPPAAIDMRDGVDFRVKACAQLGEPDFQLAHSLLAQTYYQYLYKEQPLLFREPAASPINDAISKVFSHLASNPHYLYSQKLVPSSHLDIKDALIVNRLYKEALENFAKLPFDISSDFWRYELFEGKIPVSKSNDAWWELRKKYEGVRAPEPYNSSNIDAFMHSSIAQVHNPATRGMISYIAQFQILKAICPEGAMLSEGCILSEDTTEKLRETMKMGSSITWLQALEMITGSDKLDATPMLEYYEPLISWLNNINELNQVVVGWDGPGTPFSPEEIPKTRSDMDGESGILSQDRVAFPGGECTHGQECLLDSHCNGTACVCNEGLYTLEIGDTVNCVPGNPADSGFGDGKGGLVIGLFASETTPEPEPSSTTKRPVRVKSAIFTYPTYLLSALILICLL